MEGCAKRRRNGDNVVDNVVVRGRRCWDSWNAVGDSDTNTSKIARRESLRRQRGQWNLPACQPVRLVPQDPSSILSTFI